MLSANVRETDSTASNVHARSRVTPGASLIGRTHEGVRYKSPDMLPPRSPRERAFSGRRVHRPMPRDLVSVGSAIVDRYYRLSNLPEPDGGAFVRGSWVGFGGVAANVA